MPAKKASQYKQVSFSDLEILPDDFEPPPAPLRGRGAQSEWPTIIDGLANNQGRWGKVPDVSASTAANLKKKQEGWGVKLETRFVPNSGDGKRGTLFIKVTSTTRKRS
jgi:hypothetical protein